MALQKAKSRNRSMIVPALSESNRGNESIFSSYAYNYSNACFNLSSPCIYWNTGYTFATFAAQMTVKVLTNLTCKRMFQTLV